MAFYSPLRYPGGKGKLADYIEHVIELNDLLDGHYVEPYAGGGAVALDLLFKEFVKTIHLNDIDVGIFSFWRSVLANTEGFCRLIHDTPISMDVWTKQHEIINNYQECSELELGFATFYLNRTNRSGILKGGVIGGKNQAGVWKMDARFNKADLIKRIEKIANYEDRISCTNLDTSDLLNDYKSQGCPKKTFFYLDPPYYVKGQGLYRNFYNHKDHLIIRKRLDSLDRAKWVVSYDNVAEVKDIYCQYRSVDFDLYYSAQVKRVASEVMFFSNHIEIPDVVLGRKAS